jgi:hypothetical protein
MLFSVDSHEDFPYPAEQVIISKIIIKRDESPNRDGTIS